MNQNSSRRLAPEAAEHDIIDPDVSEEQDEALPEAALNVSRSEASEVDLVDQSLTVPVEDEDEYR